MVFFDTAKRMAERLYSLPPFLRLGLMQEVIALARAGDPALRRILTHHLLLRQTNLLVSAFPPPRPGIISDHRTSG